MFDKFNDAARRAVTGASAAARDTRFARIGTGHLLLALTQVIDGEQNKAVEVMLALCVQPATVRDQCLSVLAGPDDDFNEGFQPFTPALKKSLELSLRGSLLLGENYIGPEHLLYGLARNTDSTAGKILDGLGFTTEAIAAAIQNKPAPVPDPTAARSFEVFVPAGRSIFKNGGKVYPDLVTAQAAHPEQEIAAFPLVLAGGEFFDVGTAGLSLTSWGRFASYPDAFAAAEDGKKAQGVATAIRIMVPDTVELRGRDGRGNDTVLGRSVEYVRVSVMSRLSAIADD